MSREQPMTETCVESADTLADNFDLHHFLHRIVAGCVRLPGVRANRRNP